MEDLARQECRRVLWDRRTEPRRVKYRWWHIIGKRKGIERRDGWDRRARAALA